MSTKYYPKWDTILVDVLLEKYVVVKTASTDSSDDDLLYELSSCGKKAGRTLIEALY
jgi:hypothetical protein